MRSSVAAISCPSVARDTRPIWLVACVVTRHDQVFTNRRYLIKRGFDFTKLDAEPTDFHLVIGMPQLTRCDRPADSVPKVARFVQTRICIGAERVQDELLSGHLRLVQIPPRNTGPTDVDLPCHADRDRLPISIQQIDVGVSAIGFAPLARLPWYGLRRRTHAIGQHADGGFRRP